MQIELVETFLDLMETGSFNRTAERLGVTQSTVSNRVRSLEAALGQKLFFRSRAGTRPTRAGQRFLDHAGALRREWNEARRAVGGAEAVGTSMRLGMQDDLAASHIGEWMARFRQALPDTSFYVELDFSAQMCSDILAGELDFALIFTPRHVPDLAYEQVGEIGYRMVSTHARCLAEVEVARYIRANYSPAFERAHQALFPELRDAPVASGRNSAVRGLLAALGGSAFVLEESARELVETGDCRFVDGADAIMQPVYAAMHVRHRHIHPHRRVLAIVKERFAPAA